MLNLEERKFTLAPETESAIIDGVSVRTFDYVKVKIVAKMVDYWRSIAVKLEEISVERNKELTDADIAHWKKLAQASKFR